MEPVANILVKWRKVGAEYETCKRERRLRKWNDARSRVWFDPATYFESSKKRPDYAEAGISHLHERIIGRD